MPTTPKVMLHPDPTHVARLRHELQRIDANLTTFISWTRLVEELRASAEIKPSEEIEAFVLMDEGIQYYVRRR